MRRPPSNLDDFLSSGEGPSGETERRRSETVPADPTVGKKRSRKATTATAKKPSQKPAGRRASADRSGREQAPPEVETPSSVSVGSERTTFDSPKVSTTMTEPATETVDRPRGRTVAGEASATVIMSVRVPIELRERLEDILAAYSGVTFSDLVIRGLQSMVNEVEQRHEERTGQPLPRRESRPEFPL